MSKEDKKEVVRVTRCTDANEGFIAGRWVAKIKKLSEGEEAIIDRW